MDKISKIQENRKQLRKDIYTKIYEQFFRKIVAAVENKQTQVFLEIPVFLVGYPLFDRSKATVYLKRQLDRSGKFENVLKVGDFELYVCLHSRKKQAGTGGGPPPLQPPPEIDFQDEFPTLVNLKKTANKLR